jgi:hypothetical protein
LGEVSLGADIDEPPPLARARVAPETKPRRHELIVSINDLNNAPASWLDENHLVVDHCVAIF